MITKPIISFCVGGYHACAVFSNNRVKCWGSPAEFGSSYGGSLGDQPSESGDNIPFVNFGTNALIAEISCATYHTCARIVGGGMKCVGDGRYGKTGLPTSSWVMQSNSLSFVNLGTGINTLSIVTGSDHTCAMVTANKVKCFGSGEYGQHGLGVNTNVGTSASQMGGNLPFVDLGVDVEVASIHSGPLSFHTCAMLSAPASVVQRIKCWGQGGSQLGYNSQNDVGDQSGEMGDNLPLVDYGAESRVKQIALGGGHTCAVLFDDNMKCHGYGYYGQLGIDKTNAYLAVDASYPTSILDSGYSVVKISAGNFHTCIVYNDLLTMKCFGDNGSGELGQGDILQRGDTPSTMIPSIPAIDLGTGSLAISMIKSGYEFNCVVFVDNSIKCFGKNSSGNLGSGSSLSLGDDPYEMGTNLPFTVLFSPTQSPSKTPSAVPTTNPTLRPSLSPTPPTPPTFIPSASPTKNPTRTPTKSPTITPTRRPSKNPSIASTKSPIKSPTLKPSEVPTTKPTTTRPTKIPTSSPSNNPSESPTRNPTSKPSKSPTNHPTIEPSKSPTSLPSKSPTSAPTNAPTYIPSSTPSDSPTNNPSYAPTKRPTSKPTFTPSNSPTIPPTLSPTRKPSPAPSENPSRIPSKSPSKAPTQSPTTVSRTDDVGLAVGLSLGLLGAAGIIGYAYRNRATFIKSVGNNATSNDNEINSKLNNLSVNTSSSMVSNKV